MTTPPPVPAPSPTFDVATSAQHFEQILALQRRYHARTMDAAQQAAQGFVFAEHDVALLQRMAAHLPQVIAVADDVVVGYTLAMHVALRDAIPSLVPMFEQFDHIRFRDRPLAAHAYMVGGQVCVDAAWRGRGLLRALYHQMRSRLPPGYALCVTEIARRNTVSLHAHLRMGFQPLHRYHDGVEDWEVVAWPLDAP